MTPDKIKCAIYARVSTDQQGESIDNQVGQCQEFVMRLGDPYDHSDLTVYRDEAVSGYYTSVFDRTSMKQAITDARNNLFKLLVFKEVSRVGRDKQENPAIIGMFEQYGVRVIAINDNYDSLNRDNITFDILSVLSEQESKKISARVSSARKQKARRGQWNGEPPIGYVLNKETKKLEADAEWSSVPQMIFDLYVNKGMGTFKVAERLNKLGIRTKQGNLWSRESVNKILRNQAYVGNVVYGTRRNQLKREYDDTGKMRKRKVQLKVHPSEWQIVEQAHPALIDRDTFEQAQLILTSKSRNTAPKRASHPLTGILVCGVCNQGMICQKRSYNGHEYRYYICKTYHKYGRHKCSQANVNADTLEQEVLEALRRRLSRVPDSKLDIKADKEHDRQMLSRELQHLREKKERLLKDQLDLFHQRDLFAADAYEEQMRSMKRGLETIGSKTAVLLEQLDGLTREEDDRSALLRLTGDFKKLADVQDRRGLLLDLIERIVLTGRHLSVQYKHDFSR